MYRVDFGFTLPPNFFFQIQRQYASKSNPLKASGIVSSTSMMYT